MKNIFALMRKLLGCGADKEPTPGDIAELCKTNKKEVYDKFWSNEEFISAYMEPGRVESHEFVVDYVLSKNYGNRIIDVGFGSGDFLKLLLQKSPEKQYEVHGLDYSNAAVERASRIIPGGKFLTGDVYAMPYEECYFDQVHCIQTLEHLAGPQNVLAEFDRVCKRDGMIVITIPNGDYDEYEGHVNFWNEKQFLDFLAPREIIDFLTFGDNKQFVVALRPYKGWRPANECGSLTR